MLFMLQRIDYILHRCGQYVRVSDDEDGDGFTFGDKQQLRVVNYILLVSMPARFMSWGCYVLIAAPKMHACLCADECEICVPDK